MSRAVNIVAQLDGIAQDMARKAGIVLRKKRLIRTHLKCDVETETIFDGRKNLLTMNITLSTPEAVQAEYAEDSVDAAFRRLTRS